MEKQKDNTWTYVIVALLLVSVALLFSVEDELKSQRTPEQIAAIEQQKKLDAEAAEYIADQHEKEINKWRDKEWTDLSAPDEYMMKAISHEYHLWVLCFLLIASGPIVMRKLKGF
ncbi:hypothetical protein [Microbulbifer epialgicus]|uniref:Uncharacterized protein n=1 Tax=Microbulbifer epialgicus TaxID=393907 RepID=A0ABV4NTP4_9GAMM